MRKQQRARRQMRQGTAMIAFIVVVLCASISIKTHGLQAQVTENEAEIAVLQEQIAKEQVRAKELLKEVQYRQTKAYVEEIAHEKLGLVYPDEIFIKANEK